jgi:glycolate dehydrogenase iron-sulfur subunit
MQTALADFIKGTAQGAHADAILRKCVHCGFCLATCPTYQLLGAELDSPRGRIYLIKQLLEGEQPTEKTLLHLDRCLTCRSCETTCPSGVRYGELADIGRAIVEAKVPRSLWQSFKRRVLAAVLPRTALFRSLLGAGRLARPFLPGSLAGKIPNRVLPAGAWPAPRHARRMVALAGCVQPALSPDINAAVARVLDRIGMSLVEAPQAGCCGALRFHLNFQEQGRSDMRALIDAWWPLVESGVEAFVMTASGCGVTVKEYGQLLEHDPRYAEKAKRISAMTRDVCEVLAAEWERIQPLLERVPELVAFHPPCTLQHGQAVRGVAENLLVRAGFQLAPVADAHLCCGSAGTYSLLQPEMAEALKRNKLTALEAGAPARILTANIGCQSHLAGGTSLPVEHWVVALERRMNAAES